ncbi:MAG TPA: hypothetical protein VJ755_00830 [Gemmatimonadales bacterium]|nr:hypothetical protein [Gemmatimonadales bacterium]
MGASNQIYTLYTMNELNAHTVLSDAISDFAGGFLQNIETCSDLTASRRRNQSGESDQPAS